MINTEFLLTSLVVVLVPGTGVIYTITTGLVHRWKASIAAAFGCTMGIVPHLTASILGLSAILHLSAQVFQIIKWVGTVYLLYLAWNMWRDQSPRKLDQTTTQVHGFQIIVKGILINLLNPKLTLFFLAFLPLFISSEVGSPTKQMLELSAIFMGMTLVIFVMYGVLASVISKYLINSPQAMLWMHRLFAIVFAVLAVKLALSEQK